ncbi:MAG TPA: DNA-3-methyladenine glycosylase 2 [Chryseosolibacter sp.]|nr:DNA-3-methyladenine glycosylase 2 [Chryseosolibacter sp.]
MLIATPPEFSFAQCLDYLKRSPRELLHQTTETAVSKAIRVGDEVILFEVSGGDGHLRIGFPISFPDETVQRAVINYVTEWFDLDTDLTPFYAIALKDRLLKNAVSRYYGYRIVGQPDLFESLVWAVLGQQINLGFAYTLKQRFVQTFGERLATADSEFFLFPSPEVVALITPEQLVPLQFSIQKTRYTIAIAEAFADGTLSKEKLQGLPLDEAKHHLMKIKGIGNWTANYALMKTFRYTNAFPAEDVGLHNAIKNLKKLPQKPTVDDVRRIFKKYKGWEAYATIYLWKTLGD